MTALVVRKCLWEAIYNIQYLWIPLVNTSYFYIDESECVASRPAALWAFVTQVCRMAGNLQLLALAVDLHRSSSNPFESYQQNEWKYRGLVVVISLITGFALLALGDEVYGLASNMTCWIQVKIFTCKLLFFYTNYTCT